MPLRYANPRAPRIARYTPWPATLPFPIRSAAGLLFRKRKLKTVGISSMVSTSMRTPPAESETARTVASARKGWKRRMRSDSARRRSVHGCPTDNSKKLPITSAWVVVWCNPTARASTRSDRGNRMNEGSCGTMRTPETILPSHCAAAGREGVVSSSTTSIQGANRIAAKRTARSVFGVVRRSCDSRSRDLPASFASVTSILTRRRTVIGCAVLAALLTGGAWWRAAWIVNQLLRSWAAATIAEKSGDVYRLNVARVRFNFALRRVAVDSILVTTNRTRNALRPRPLAALRFAFHQCTISGVHLITLILHRGLVAESFGCRAVSVAVVVPPSGGLPDTVGQLHTVPRAFLAVQQSLRLPSFAPRMRIARSDFPHVSLDFRLQRAGAGDAR